MIKEVESWPINCSDCRLV